MSMNLRPAAIEKILKRPPLTASFAAINPLAPTSSWGSGLWGASLGPSPGVSTGSWSFKGLSYGQTLSSYTTPETGNYFLHVLFYLFLYTFVAFLIAILVHFTITPVFSFVPGSPGIIRVPAQNDSLVYWKNGKQPLPESRVPLQGDSLSNHMFDNNFSFSLDIYARKITDSDSNRLILYKTHLYGPDLKPPVNAPFSITAAATNAGLAAAAGQATPVAASGSTTLAAPTSDLLSTMSGVSSMIMFLTSSNDLVVTFFSGLTGTNYSCAPIKNIPLYTPFRITVVVEKTVFTVYLNGKQTFQRVLPSPLTLNSSNSLNTKSQYFYAAPQWANNPTQTIFVQNLQLWPRAITYDEVKVAQPSLASVASFNAPVETGSGQC
jgi:hypothetical protein